MPPGTPDSLASRHGPHGRLPLSTQWREVEMRFDMMLPYQVRSAAAANWPFVLPLGVLEYHGEHLALGLDTLLVVKALEGLEDEIDMVILPPFPYGAASYAVEPPEGTGTLQVNA